MTGPGIGSVLSSTGPVVAEANDLDAVAGRGVQRRVVEARVDERHALTGPSRRTCVDRVERDRVEDGHARRGRDTPQPGRRSMLTPGSVPSSMCALDGRLGAPPIDARPLRATRSPSSTQAALDVGAGRAHQVRRPGCAATALAVGRRRPAWPRPRRWPRAASRQAARAGRRSLGRSARRWSQVEWRRARPSSARGDERVVGDRRRWRRPGPAARRCRERPAGCRAIGAGCGVAGARRGRSCRCCDGRRPEPAT